MRTFLKRKPLFFSGLDRGSNDRHDCGDSQSLLAKDTPETHGATEATGGKLTC